jgi:tetratricopeptide (TPR) repeat protein
MPSDSARTEKKKVSKKAKGYMRILQRLLSRAENRKKKGNFTEAALLYQKISYLARDAGEWDDGVKYAVLSAECSERDGRPFKAGWAYRAAALSAKSGEKHEKAMEHASMAAKRFREAGSIFAAKWCYGAAAEAAKAAGKPSEAIRFYEKSKEIEDDDETKDEIRRIKNVVSHPVVDQYAEKDEITEGEEAKFEIVIENHSKETLRKIVVGDRDARVTHEVEELGPGEITIFSHGIKGKTGILHSPYNFITWQDAKGSTLDFELEPVSVRVKPRLQFTPSVEPEAVVNKPCKLILLVKNLSTVPVLDVKIDLKFIEGVRVPHPGPRTFERIGPGEEYGASWGIMPTVPGRHRIAEGKVTVMDGEGNEFTDSTGEIIIGIHPKESHHEASAEGTGPAPDSRDALKKRYDDVRELMTSAEKKYLQRKLDEESFKKIMQEYGKEKAELELRLRKEES